MNFKLKIDFDHEKFIKILLITIIIDYFWINFYAKDRFSKIVMDIQGSPLNVKFLPTIASYLLIAWSIYLIMGISNDKVDLIMAFLLGSAIYGIFDFTNLAIFDNYSFPEAIVDTIWGGVLYALVIQVYRLSDPLIKEAMKWFN